MWRRQNHTDLEERSKSDLDLSILFYPITLEGRRGTTDEFRHKLGPGQPRVTICTNYDKCNSLMSENKFHHHRPFDSVEENL